MELKGKKVLVTGADGFIGSHLAEHLLSEGHRVLIVDDLSTGQASNLATIQNHENVEYIEGTGEDESVVAEVVDRADRVYHLAAAVGKPVTVGFDLLDLLRVRIPKSHRCQRIDRERKAVDKCAHA